MCIREDGGWRTHGVNLLYRPSPGMHFRTDLRLACPREPREVGYAHSVPMEGVSLLHLGWANPEERLPRFSRYMKLDGGNWHARGHLESILWLPDRIELRGREWPPALAAIRPEIESRVNPVHRVS
jgi:hypothetical protein